MPVINVLINKFTVAYLTLMIVACLVHLDTQTKFTVPQQWIKSLGKQCPHLNLEAINFEEYNFKKISNSFHIIGSYFGIVFDQQMSPARNLTHFNRTSLITSIFRTAICAIPLVPLLVLQKVSAKVLPGVFKNPPMLYLFPVIQGFFLFGFTKIVAQKLGLANTDEDPYGKTSEGDDVELVSIMNGQDIVPLIDKKSSTKKKTR